MSPGPTTFKNLTPPVLVLDAAKMMRNIKRLEARADALGVTLRPHLKSAKSPHVARHLRGGGQTILPVLELLYRI